MKHILLICCFAILLTNNIQGQESLNVSEFKNPGNNSGVHTWWHWMNGNITKEGITKDLESMHDNGIVQATILNIGFINDVVTRRVVFDTPEWYDMFRFALKEADRLGMSIGAHNCDGWSNSGGTWITPDLSMKTYVWTKTYISGGKTVKLMLEQPPARRDYYRDYAVIAFPSEDKTNKFQRSNPEIKINGRDTKRLLYDGNPKTTSRIRKGGKLTIRLPEILTVNRLSLFGYMTFTWGDLDKIKSAFSLSYSTDGTNYNKISDLEFVGLNTNLAAHFPETKAKYFEIECLSDEFPLAEIGLLYNEENANFFNQIPHLFEAAIHTRASAEDNFAKITDSSGRGIPESSILDITKFVSPDGTLNWNVPEGDWCIIRFGYTTNGVTNTPATAEGVGLECDKFDSTTVKLHFDNFSQKLIDASGDYKGNTFKFLLLDSWECQYQNWSKNFSENFRELRGYDIKNWIPVLCGEIVEDAHHSSGFLHDFRKTISDLTDNNYYRYFKKLCRENNLELHTEVIYGDAGTFAPLDVLRSNKYMDMPMSEFWARPNDNQLPIYTPLERPVETFPTYSPLTNSTPILGAEAYTGFAHFSETPALLKPYGDMAFCSGINQLILHSFVHQPIDKMPIMTLGPFGGHYNRNNPWWDFSQYWLNYQARIQFVLQKGDRLADVIYFVGDKLSQYLPRSIMKDLPVGYNANICNSEMMQNDASVVDGMLSFGGKQTFPLLILPDNSTMEYVTLKKIAELISEGLVVLGTKPDEMISLSDIKTNTVEFNKLIDDLWGNTSASTVTYGKGKVITKGKTAEVLKSMSIIPDFSSNTSKTDLLYIHKQLEEYDVYFVFNQQNKVLNSELLFRMKDVVPEIWNPESGLISKPVIYSSEGEQIRVPVTFKPHESLFFVFKKGHSANSIKAVYLDGKQIFPDKFNMMKEIPIGFFDKKYGFTTNNSGSYTFITSENESIERTLSAIETIEIEKYKAQLEFFPNYDEKVDPVTISKLKSLTEFDDLSVKYFAGKVKYTITFDSPEKFKAKDNLILNIGDMSATAEVSLNGKFLKYAWQPYEDIRFSGLLKKNNKLEITVATTCRNRFIGDLIQYGKPKNISTTGPEDTLKKDMPLTISGIAGPLRLSKQ